MEEDNIPVIVMNLGEEKKVSVTVQINDMNGQTFYEKEYTNVTLPAGRNKLDLEQEALEQETFRRFRKNY